MTAYKDPSMINRFIKHIPDDWGIYIHIDRKSDIDISDIIKGRIYKQKRIYWGGDRAP